MAAIKIVLPRGSLLVLCGPAGCGKSTFAAARFLPTEIVSSDHCRALICDDEANQRVHRDTFNLFHYIINTRLRLGRTTVADSTALQAFARRRLLEQAQRNDCHACLLIFNISPETCLARDQLRPRSVGAQVIQNHARLLEQTLLAAPLEGWSSVFVLEEQDVEGTAVELIEQIKPIEPSKIPSS